MPLLDERDLVLLEPGDVSLSAPEAEALSPELFFFPCLILRCRSEAVEPDLAGRDEEPVPPDPPEDPAGCIPKPVIIIGLVSSSPSASSSSEPVPLKLLLLAGERIQSGFFGTWSPDVDDVHDHDQVEASWSRLFVALLSLLSPLLLTSFCHDPDTDEDPDAVVSLEPEPVPLHLLFELDPSSA